MRTNWHLSRNATPRSILTKKSCTRLPTAQSLLLSPQKKTSIQHMFKKISSYHPIFDQPDAQSPLFEHWVWMKYDQSISSSTSLNISRILRKVRNQRISFCAQIGGTRCSEYIYREEERDRKRKREWVNKPERFKGCTKETHQYLVLAHDLIKRTAQRIRMSPFPSTHANEKWFCMFLEGWYLFACVHICLYGALILLSPFASQFLHPSSDMNSTSYKLQSLCFLFLNKSSLFSVSASLRCRPLSCVSSFCSAGNFSQSLKKKRIW